MNAGADGLCATSTFESKVDAFVALHRRRSTTGFVTNVDVDVDTIDAGGMRLPVTINDPDRDNAWVVSPRTTYGAYALEETRRLMPRALAPALGAVIATADRAMRRAAIDRAVSVDNWLLSTNLHPHHETIDVDAIVAGCVARWPGHAIWLRSLNRTEHAGWLDRLVTAGFELIPTRQVYLFPRIDRTRSRDLRRDLRLLDTTPFVEVPHERFDDARFERSAALYAQLYLDKYSRCNPRYTGAFLAAWHRAGLLEFNGYEDADGRLQAVVAMFAIGGSVTAPVVGYERTLPQSAGLYRLLMATVLRTTAERGAVLNLSAGAAHFKRLRGGEPTIEYSAVFCRHLPVATRRVLWTMRQLTTRIGVPVMRRFEL